MDDLKHTERLLNLVYMIQNSPGIQARELAKIFGRTTRTIQRDICNLRKAGFSITSSTGAAGGFASRGSYYLKPLVFTGAEALAVFVASRVLLEQNGFPYTNDLKSALGKISQVICEKDEQFFQSLEPKTSVVIKQMKDYYPWEKIFSQINQAILDQVTVEINYDSYSSHTVSVRRVNPYHMLFREGCWYLIGFCQLRKEIRIFRIDRIRNLDILNTKFQIASEFCLEDFFKNSWYLGKGNPIIVKVRFNPPVSRLIRENIWHPTQKIEELEGDSLILTVCVEGTWEIKKWILSWGAGAVCLEPEELREEIRREVQELLAKYYDNA
ncbi:Transcriptional regulator, DeoR family [Desulfosporosinus sp. I2]|uniref:helix-turn-helix transcriptional regulator n=1 Tax=Desulfosporosinus sp. I2 TaxID=1617025 RepID=UPI00061E3963|nr:WYL domain-containing protein [Desulfosporosinus sp. I2]KJR44584.1 Transcriptional regulator, DeoR family [Desulfosporosinus sp. I2]